MKVVNVDTNIRTYHLNFVHKSEMNKYKTRDIINKLVVELDNTKELIESFKDYIKTDFNINLDSYKDYTENDCIKNNLYIKVYNTLEDCKNSEDRYKLNTILKFCNICKRIATLTEAIDIYDKYSKIKFREYERYVNKYYNVVHRLLLQGYAYKFNSGIGTIMINKWNIQKDKVKPILDFDATNKRKKELLEKGIKLYDDKEATWYEARNIPYDGVDYRIYKYPESFYRIDIIHSKYNTGYPYVFKKSEYCHRDIKHLPNAEKAKLYKTEEEIYNMPASLYHKHAVLMINHNYKYINFVRNDEQLIYKY